MEQNVTFKMLPHLTIMQCKELVLLKNLSDFYIIVQNTLG